MSDADIETIVRAVARANYRQTCVNLDDGILQRSWHELNEFLRLTGIGLTGVMQWEHQNDAKRFRALRDFAVTGVDSMADELHLPRTKNCTTIKPSGTLSKIMDCTEGVHKPLGKFIFNNVRFSRHDPLVPKLRAANYFVFNDPYAADSVLIRFPVKYEGVPFDIVDGKEVNLESAVSQLNRYKMLMEEYVQHNCSVTVSYSVDEVPAILDWFMDNWDCYIGVSFLFRNDPSKTAADLGYPYLPQEVVDERTFETYVATLASFSIDDAAAADGDVADEGSGDGDGNFEIETGGDCALGSCPVK